MIFLLNGKSSLIIPYTETYQEWKKNEYNTTCSIGSRQFNASNGEFCIGSVTKPVRCDKDNNCYGIDLG